MGKGLSTARRMGARTLDEGGARHSPPGEPGQRGDEDSSESEHEEVLRPHQESMLRIKLGSFDSKSWAAVFVISRQRKAGQLFS